MDLNSWKKDWTLMSAFFNGSEISSITERLRNLKVENLVFCSFENRFAKSGGLAAVTTNILPYLKEVNNIPMVCLMTPMYPNIIDRKKLSSTGVQFHFPFKGKKVEVSIFKYEWHYNKPCTGTVTEYYLYAKGFFESGNKLNDPYSYDESNNLSNSSRQRLNAMFFCKCVPLALKHLNISENIIFHLNEWQTSLITLTSKEAMTNGTLKSCGTIQTMHNSYDAIVPWNILTDISDSTRKDKIMGFPGSGKSAYQIGLQLVDAPVTTVSDHFAAELTSDIIQTEYYAPHLQTILKANKVIGINNGMFVDFSKEFPSNGTLPLSQIKNIKIRKRKALLRVLSSYKPPERFGELTYKGRTISKLPEDIPIIVMSGRLDPTQKGYYVLLRAIERFKEDEIKVVLTPLPVHESDLDYFYEVACKCKGNLTVFPVRMETGYHELQKGATFGIMPSIYEPFGAAVEYMANGTVNIGRATGGLVDQIDNKCGFLFKEDAAFYTSENLHDFISSSEIIQSRKSNAWAQSMADNLYNVLSSAIEIYKNNNEEYYEMILRGFEKASKFNWESNAKKYLSIYNMASNI